MDRREMFGLLGAVGAGVPLAAGTACGDHGKADAGGPAAGPHHHFCGFHAVKANPAVQFVTQHYCTAHAADGHADPLFQCFLFDGTGKNAKLLGVEYIVTDAVYRALPDGEKKFWHPHTYEVLGGGLIATGMTPEEEMKFVSGLLTTWGKAWHTWPDPKTAVPLGEPVLIWSLTGDGQADEKLVAARDRAFNVDTAKVGAARRAALGLERPNVSRPKSADAVGRQWTDTGEDKPTKLK